jgi:hypothetical protein
MENQDQTPPNDKGPTPVNESKPVGYGSSIQSDGNGNRTRPQNQEDVNPTTQQDHIQDLKTNEDGDDEIGAAPADRIPNTNGTGANREVFNDDSLIIKDED